MPVRTAYVGTEAVGDVLTKANFDKLPGGWIGYAEVTTSQAAIGTTPVDLTGLTVTVTVNTSRRIRITGFDGALGSASANLSASLLIMEGATQLGRADCYLPTSFTASPGPHSVVVTPTAGSHTYKLQASSSTGTYTANMAATFPGYILVEDIGPAS